MPKYPKRKISKNLKTYIQRKIESNIETKHHFNDSSGISVTTTSASIQVPVIPQGDDEFRRTGNKVNATGFYGRFHIVSSASHVVRLVLYIPKDPSSNITLNTYGLIDRNEFTVLSDKLITLSANGVSNKVVTLSKKWNRGNSKGMEIEWASSTTTDVKKNNVKLAYISDASSGVAMDFHWALYFKDA